MTTAAEIGEAGEATEPKGVSGVPVLHGVSGTVAGESMSLSEFERFCLMMRHQTLTFVWQRRSFFAFDNAIPMFLTDYAALDSDPDPPHGPGPHREGPNVRTWWCGRRNYTAEDLERYLNERGYASRRHR